MIPRPYQITAVENTLKLLFEEKGANPVIAVPPGGGKSSIIAWTMKAIMRQLPHVRLINCTHVKELVAQDSNELARVWPNAPFGVYSAGLNSKQTSMPITIASIQSVIKNMDAFGKQAGLFIDEAHLLSPAAETSYQRFITRLREDNPNMFIAGYSATPWRMKHGLLTQGNIFNCTAFDNTQKEDFVELIDDGYLVPLIPKAMSFKFDVSKIRKVAGDFNQDELQRLVNVDEISRQALQEALQVAHDRKHWLIFCSGIDHVEAVTRILQAWGERAVFVHSKMPRKQRDQAILDFKQGRARMIVSEGILTTGFNSPWVDCIVLLRPTASPGLHVQILGRGIRAVYGSQYTEDMLEDKATRLRAIAESEKQYCLVLDFAGNSDRLGPINDPMVPQPKGKGTGDAPVKICPECGTYVHAALRFCNGYHWDGRKCDHEFQFETHLEATAATTALIARDDPVYVWFQVDRVDYEIYDGYKHDKPTMMRVHYYCGIRRFTEMVCIDHQGYAGKKARDWWRGRLMQMGMSTVTPPPDTVTGMSFVNQLPKPTHIYVHANLKHPRVMAESYDGTTPVFTPAIPTALAAE